MASEYAHHRKNGQLREDPAPSLERHEGISKEENEWGERGRVMGTMSDMVHRSQDKDLFSGGESWRDVVKR